MELPASESAGQQPAASIVADVMRQAATTVETEGHLAAAAYLMNHADQSALVVLDDTDRPIALITEADLLRARCPWRGYRTGAHLTLDEARPADR